MMPRSIPNPLQSFAPITFSFTVKNRYCKSYSNYRQHVCVSILDLTLYYGAPCAQLANSHFMSTNSHGKIESVLLPSSDLVSEISSGNLYVGRYLFSSVRKMEKMKKNYHAQYWHLLHLQECGLMSVMFILVHALKKWNNTHSSSQDRFLTKNSS